MCLTATLLQFRSLYVGKCEVQVIREVWTRYLLQGDPFLVFYLALVILVNARDVILDMDNCAGYYNLVLLLFLCQAT